MRSRIVGIAIASQPPSIGIALNASVDGRVSLEWTHHESNVANVVVEASSASGMADLAQIPATAKATTLLVSGVPTATYFVRVRMQKSNGTSATFNEVRMEVR